MNKLLIEYFYSLEVKDHIYGFQWCGYKAEMSSLIKVLLRYVPSKTLFVLKMFKESLLTNILLTKKGYHDESSQVKNVKRSSNSNYTETADQMFSNMKSVAIAVIEKLPNQIFDLAS